MRFDPNPGHFSMPPNRLSFGMVLSTNKKTESHWQNRQDTYLHPGPSSEPKVSRNTKTTANFKLARLRKAPACPRPVCRSKRLTMSRHSLPMPGTPGSLLRTTYGSGDTSYGVRGLVTAFFQRRCLSSSKSPLSRKLPFLWDTSLDPSYGQPSNIPKTGLQRLGSRQ